MVQHYSEFSLLTPDSRAWLVQDCANMAKPGLTHSRCLREPALTLNQYDCQYRLVPRRRKVSSDKTNAQVTQPVSEPKSNVPMSSNSPSLDSPKTQDGDNGNFARSLESNSGSAFVRRFAMAVDPSNAPAQQMLGWNIFLGERQTLPNQLPTSVSDLLSQADMQALAQVYFAKVDPCYGFVERPQIERAIHQRWQPLATEGYDAVLCGIAAIGCLFSTLQSAQVESALVFLAKSHLDLATSASPTIDSATAWVLRTVYLRMAAKLDEAWISSCTTLHMIDAAGLHYEPDVSVPFGAAHPKVDPDLRRRIFGVARHLNIWLSFDLGRSRVVLQNVSTVAPLPRPGDHSTELLELLPYSEDLDPGKQLTSAHLLKTISEVLKRDHAFPTSVLAQFVATHPSTISRTFADTVHFTV